MWFWDMEPPGCVIKNDLQLNLHGDSEFFGIYIGTKLLKNGCLLS